MDTLFLTAEEKKLFDSLPDTLKQEWKGTLVTETGTAMETDDQLHTRLRLLSYDKHPKLQELMKVSLEKMQKGGTFDAATIVAQIPSESLPVVLFTLGARGVTLLLDVALREVKDGAGIAGIADLTHIRHILFDVNTAIPHSLHA